MLYCPQTNATPYLPWVIPQIMHVLYSVQVRTHTGSVRDVNEDAVSSVLDWRATLDLADADLQARGHLFAVADGMGGHAAGEVASKLAMEEVFRRFYNFEGTPREALSAAIAAANEALIEKAASATQYAGLGTTLVAALLRGDSLTIANVGDSRAYLFRQNTLSQITHDHSWVAEQLTAGVLSPEEAERHPYRNVITHSLGPDRDPTPDFFRLSLQPGDLVLLCSDGLTNMVSNEELAEFLGAYPPNEAADILLERTLERGAPDNVSLALIAFQGEKPGKGRQAWPWVLAGIIALALLVVALREPLLRLVPGPAAFIAAADATATPSPSPTLTPLPTNTPTPLPLPSPHQAQPLRSATIEPGPAPAVLAPEAATCFEAWMLPECYAFYLEGALAPRRDGLGMWSGTITHRQSDGEEQRYLFTVREGQPAAAPPPPRGATVALVGQPAVSDDISGDIRLEPLLLMDGEGHLLWSNGDHQPELWLGPEAGRWYYTVFGPGGGEGLGIETPAGATGQAIALFGYWQPAAEDETVWQFQPLLSPPYELGSDGVYRPPDH